MPCINRPIAAGAAMLAALSLGAPQAFALDLPARADAPFKATSATGEPLDYHRYRRYHHNDRYHRHHGIDAGDVIGGILVIGAIAAIANAAKNDRRERVEPYPRRQPRREEVRYRDDRDERRSDSRGIDRAIDMCVEQVERGDTRIDSVDNAARAADGWRVSGALDNGESWNCWIDNDGRVRSVDFGSRYSASVEPSTSRNSVRFESAAAAGVGQSQWSDADYARARAGTSSSPSVDRTAQSDADLRAREEELQAGEASYPGGPVDGEDYPGGEWVDDGRYTSASLTGDAARS